MYEKHGLMSKISNPLVLSYLRNQSESNTRIIERALRKKLGIQIDPECCESRGRKKDVDSRNKIPVKVVDPMLVKYLISQRKIHGVSHRYTIENAILEMIAVEKNQ